LKNKKNMGGNVRAPYQGGKREQIGRKKAHFLKGTEGGGTDFVRSWAKNKISPWARISESAARGKCWGGGGGENSRRVEVKKKKKNKN